jgi:RHS repeat-associated protein
MTFNATPPTQTYTYDQENRLTGAAGYTYTYDGDGNRVRKSNGNLAANGTLYWEMTPGVVAETDLAGTIKSEYIFFDGERVARRDGVNGAGGVFYYFSDHLKTASVITDSAAVIKAESDYYPWGGELQFVNNDSNDYKFTGKKRDAETGLDYFGARYYSNGLGRFISPDSPFADQHATDPQTWNLYSYTRNNPVRFTDDTGHATRPAKTASVNSALAADKTFNQVILASPNFSPGAFEDALNSGALSNFNSGEGSKLRGLAAEANAMDTLNYNTDNFHSAYPQPTSLPGVQPDIGVFIDNDLGMRPTELQNVATSFAPGGVGNNFTLEPGVRMAFMEIKSGLSASGIKKGVEQAVATAQAIDKAGADGIAVSVLVVDAKAWTSLKPTDRSNYITQMRNAGAYVQVQLGLTGWAQIRAQDLVDRASSSTGKDNDKH